MSTPSPASGSRPPGWQQEHARRYVASGGQDGHIWEGVPTLLLTTTGSGTITCSIGRDASLTAQARSRMTTGIWRAVRAWYSS